MAPIFFLHLSFWDGTWNSWGEAGPPSVIRERWRTSALLCGTKEALLSPGRPTLRQLSPRGTTTRPFCLQDDQPYASLDPRGTTTHPFCLQDDPRGTTTRPFTTPLTTSLTLVKARWSSQTVKHQSQREPLPPTADNSLLTMRKWITETKITVMDDARAKPRMDWEAEGSPNKKLKPQKTRGTNLQDTSLLPSNHILPQGQGWIY